MKILHVLDGYFLAGIENQAFEIIKNYPENNKCFLLNTSPSVKDTYPKFKSLKKKKKLTDLKDLSCKSPILATLFLCRYLIKNKIDSVVIYPCNKKMIYIVLASRLAGVKKIFLSVQNVICSSNKLDLFKIKILFQIFNLLKVFFVPASKSILDSMINLNINFKKYRVIHNSCDVDRIKKITKRNKENKKIKTITMIARLDKIKDQETLIRAFSKLNFLDWKLQIVGKGPKLESLKNTSSSLGLNPKSIFCGERYDVMKILSETDIFAFSTTEAEGFGIVLIEAMAANLPIVASDVSACKEILFEGKVGMLIPAGNVKSWENALRKLMKSHIKRRRLIINNNKYVKIYDSKNIIKKWYELLHFAL